MAHKTVLIMPLVLATVVFAIASNKAPGIKTTPTAQDYSLTYTPPSTPPLIPPKAEEKANLVSWQSAFFGLVALALNAMTQPSTIDKTFPRSSLLFPARSSPFVCMADALEILVAFGFHWFRGVGVREAAWRIHQRRAREQSGGHSDNDEWTIEKTPAEKHPKTFLILFITSLLQGVKIFGMTGLPWTQVWAGMYLELDRRMLDSPFQRVLLGTSPAYTQR
ncbi:hypothetical protein B0O99DRAFT_603095 [Bisporella sp. PMI_857]|nr:hypothetical protein B0O99DRAFT_603095 [Bisporella sp. PMI_857]